MLERCMRSRALELEVYHASNKQVATFTHWLHVGTREAAIQRLARLGYHHGYLYRFRMRVDDSAVEKVADWGASGANDLLDILARTDSLRIRKEFFEGARALIVSIRENVTLDGDKNPRKFLEHELQQFVIDWLEAVGIKVLRYENHVEDCGSASYCILCDPRYVLMHTGCEEL